MVFMMSSDSLASSGSEARPTHAYTIPWLSSLSKGTWGVCREGLVRPTLHPSPLRPRPRPHLEDEAELRVEEAGVSADLDAPGEGEVAARSQGSLPTWPPPHAPSLSHAPGAEGTAVGANLVKAWLQGTLGHLPLAPMDDELSLEMG